MFRDDLVPARYTGETLTITGQVIDVDGQPVPDAVLEVWQAEYLGRYISSEPWSSDGHGAFQGWGRIPTDAKGAFQFRAVMPGAVPGVGDAWQTPHINVTLFMRGLLRHLFARIYFEGEPANQTDPVLLMVPEKRRPTLIAKRSAAGATNYSWNIVLQGAEETVFFDW